MKRQTMQAVKTLPTSSKEERIARAEAPCISLTALSLFLWDPLTQPLSSLLANFLPYVDWRGTLAVTGRSAEQSG
eukprot:1151564-Pelagomonas_calceolata.AAC.1